MEQLARLLLAVLPSGLAGARRVSATANDRGKFIAVPPDSKTRFPEQPLSPKPS